MDIYIYISGFFFCLLFHEMWQGVVSRNTPESHNVMAVSVPCFGTRLPQFRCWHIEVIEVMSMNEVMSRRHHEVEAVQD